MSTPPDLALEGRLLAHRALLAHLVALLPPGVGDAAREWLEERVIPMDGQEDPGAVPTGAAAGMESTADEYRQLLALLTRTVPG